MNRSAVLAALLAVGLVATPALAAVEDEPRFEVSTPEPRLEPGASQAVTFELVNDAKDPEDRVPSATAVRVEPRAGNTPFEVVSGPRSLGRMADGEIHTVDVRLDVPADAPGGTYRLPLRVTYEYEGDERDTETVRATVRVPRRPIFLVTDTDSTVVVGERGTATVSLRNVGSLDARATSLVLASPNPEVTFGGAVQTTVYVGDWPAGATRNVTVQPTATEAASQRSYPLEVRPTYRDESGIERTAPTRFAGIDVMPAQSFAFENVSLSLYGTTAIATATVTNEGPAPTTETVATIEATNPTISVVEATAPAGDLGVGESARVTYTLRVDRRASAGSHRLDAIVRYDRGDETYRAGPTPLVVDVPADRERFAVQSVNATLERDASNTLTVRLTNEGDERLHDLRARLSVPPPYESQRPTAFVDALDPGESARLTFEVTTPEDAVPGEDAIPLNVTGQTPDDRSFRAGPYVVPFTIPGEDVAEDDLLLLGVGVVVVAVLLGAGWWWLRH